VCVCVCVCVCVKIHVCVYKTKMLLAAGSTATNDVKI